MSAQAMPIPGPLSIGDIIDRAFRIYRTRFKPMVLTALLLLVPLAVVTGALSYLLNRYSFAATSGADLGASLSSSLGSVALSLLDWLVQGIAELALTFHAIAALRNLPMEPRASIAAAGSRLGSWLGMSLLRALAYVALIIGPLLPTFALAVLVGENEAMAVGVACLFGIAMIAIFVLAVVLQVRWIVSTPSLVVEELGATASLGRSWFLTRGKFWRSFGVAVVLAIIGIIVLGLPTFVLGAIALIGTAQGAWWSALGTALGTILSALYVPLSAATYVVLYYDLRVRRENLDLDQRVQQLEAETSGQEESNP